MANIILPPDWQLKPRDTTDLSVYSERRNFIKKLGLGTIGLALGPSVLNACTTGGAKPTLAKGPLDTIPANAPRDGLPAARNAEFGVPERPMTDRVAAASYNNFYEFDGSSKVVWQLTDKYDPFPWTIEVDGMVEKPFRIDVTELIRVLGLEERDLSLQVRRSVVDDSALDRIRAEEAH